MTNPKLTVTSEAPEARCREQGREYELHEAKYPQANSTHRPLTQDLPAVAAQSLGPAVEAYMCVEAGADKALKCVDANANANASADGSGVVVACNQ